MTSRKSLDPADWTRFRELSHRMVDEIFEHLEGLSEGPAWQQVPVEVTERILTEPVPHQGEGEEAVYEQFMRDVLPYPNGNLHPRFFGWVQGNGIPFANMADLLASAMNPHLSGFNQAPVAVERKVVEWLAELMGFPKGTSGVLESGGTMANILGLAVARSAKSGFDVRKEGLQSERKRVTIYCSSECHGWITKGVELLGIGSDFLRKAPVDEGYRVKVTELRRMIEEDLAAGLKPICVVGTAGTVNLGVTDDLNALADLCADYGIWFHVDGAFGAFAKLSPKYRHLVAGLERADSLGLDLHKWMYLPFELACILVRDEKAHTDAFAFAPSYIAQLERGVIAGGIPFSDRGIDLTRGFKALKAWMCMKAYGVDAFAEMIERNVEQTQLLVSLVEASPLLEMAGPAPMNIACFRVKGSNEVNMETLFRVQESGVAVPSSTEIDGKFVLRVCNVNHRCQDEDIDKLVEAVVFHGAAALADAQ